MPATMQTPHGSPPVKQRPAVWRFYLLRCCAPAVQQTARPPDAMADSLLCEPQKSISAGGDLLRRGGAGFCCRSHTRWIDFYMKSAQKRVSCHEHWHHKASSFLVKSLFWLLKWDERWSLRMIFNFHNEDCEKQEQQLYKKMEKNCVK